MKQLCIAALLTAGTMLLTMCSDKDNEPGDLTLTVTPGAESVASLYSGEKALYEVEIGSSYTGCRLKITSFEQNNGLQVMVDTAFNTTTETAYSYVYTAPELNREKSEVKLTFTATDSEGLQVSETRKINVHNRAVSLEEQTGIVLYAPSSGRPDALTLNDPARPFILAEAPRPDTADVYIESLPDFGNITMRSNSETKFIRMNTFNYSSATAAGIVAAYQNSVHADLVSDISINDIIIVGQGGNARGVFFVANILRGQGSADCMQLNYKGVVTTN